jgi:hypothetical protein
LVLFSFDRADLDRAPAAVDLSEARCGGSWRSGAAHPRPPRASDAGRRAGGRVVDRAGERRRDVARRVRKEEAVLGPPALHLVLGGAGALAVEATVGGSVDRLRGAGS